MERFFLGTYPRILHRFGPAVVAVCAVWVMACAWASADLPPERTFDTRDLFPPTNLHGSLRAIDQARVGSSRITETNLPVHLVTARGRSQ